MNIVKSAYDGNSEWLTILPSACWHIGHINCRMNFIDGWANRLDDTHRGLLLGDLGEFATKTSIGKGLFDTNMTPAKQKDTIIKILKPKKQFIDGMVKGNHEERIEQNISIDILKDVSEYLEIPYLNYSGFVKYSWNDIAYTVKIWHGNGGGSTAGTALKTCEEMSNRSFADIFIIAHFHKNLKSDKIIEIPDVRNMKVEKRKQTFVCIGSALDYDDSYADMKGLQGRDLGWSELKLHGVKGEREIKVIS